MFSEIAKRLNELRGKPNSWTELIDTLIGSFGHCRAPLKHHGTVDIDINNTEESLRGLGDQGLPDALETDHPDDILAALKVSNEAGFIGGDGVIKNGVAAVFRGPVVFQNINIANKPGVDVAGDNIFVFINGGVQTTTMNVTNINVTNIYDSSGNDYISTSTRPHGELQLSGSGWSYTGGSTTKINWDTAGASSEVTVSTSNDNLTVDHAGKYLLTWTFGATATSGTSPNTGIGFSLDGYVGGSLEVAIAFDSVGCDDLGGVVGFPRFSGHTILDLSASDDVDIRFTSTENWYLHTGFFSLVKI